MRLNDLKIDSNLAVQKETRLALARALAPGPPGKPKMVKQTLVSYSYQRLELVTLRPRAERNYRNQPVVVAAGHRELAQLESAVWSQIENLDLFHTD